MRAHAPTSSWWFIQTFDESRLSWLRELFPEAGKCFTRFQRKHRIPSVSHLIERNLALKPASAACRTVHARSTRSFCGQKRLALAKKKPEADKEPIANPSGTPSSDLARLFLSQSSLIIRLSGQETVLYLDGDASWSQPDGEPAYARV